MIVLFQVSILPKLNNSQLRSLHRLKIVAIDL